MRLGVCIGQIIYSNNLVPRTQIDHTQVDEAEAQFKLKDYYARHINQNQNRYDAKETHRFVLPKIGFTPCTHM